MIDLSKEQLIAIRDIPKLLPRRPNGKRVHVATCYRWVLKGCKGVRLEAVKVGGTLISSREALQRFSDRLTQGGMPQSEASTSIGVSRQRQIEQVSRRVGELLS